MTEPENCNHTTTITQRMVALSTGHEAIATVCVECYTVLSKQYILEELNDAG